MIPALVRHALAVAGVDLFALYRYAVRGTNADGSLELAALDDRLPDLSRVPLSGAGLTVPDGATVLVGHRNGDPRFPFAALFDGPMREVTITAGKQLTVRVPDLELGDGDRLPVAREGDLVTFPFGPEPLALTGSAGGLAFVGEVAPGQFVGTIEATATKTRAA